MPKSTFKRHYELPVRDIFGEREYAQLLRELWHDGKIKDIKITVHNARRYALLIKLALAKSFGEFGGIGFPGICSIRKHKWKKSRIHVLKGKVYQRKPYAIRTRWNHDFMMEIRGDESAEDTDE